MNALDPIGRRRVLRLLGSAPLAAGVLPALAADPGPFAYHLVPLDTAVPDGYLFFDPAGVDERRRVLGTLYGFDANGEFAGFVAAYRGGRFTVLQPGYVTCATRTGLAASFVVNP